MSLFRHTLFILSVLSVTLPVYAQNEKGKDIRLNEEAIRMIQFDFSGTKPPHEEIKAATLDKPWMNFKKDLRLPRSLTDTTKVKKPTEYVRMLPYTIWTRFGEDPVYDVLVLGRPKKWEMHWTLNPNAVYTEEYGRSLPAGTGMMYERATSPVGGSVVIGGLDFIGAIYNNLTPRGRMLKYNRKHANAWKIYKDYRPTREDSLKFPTYYRLLPVYTEADTIATMQQADTLTVPARRDTVPNVSRTEKTETAPQPEADHFYEYIRQRQAEDSIRRQEFFRKDKVRNNSYEVEKQIRRIKEKQW